MIIIPLQKRVILWIGCLLFLILFNSRAANAVAQIGFKPTLGKDIHLNTTVSAGKSKKIDYTVVNLSNAKLSVEPRLDISLAGQGENENLNSARSFIKLPPQPLILDPSQRKYLSFDISIPENTIPGQYTAVLSLQKSDTAETLAQSKMIVTVDGQLTKNLAASITSNINNDKIFLNFDLENKGNTAIDNVVAHISLLNQNLSAVIKLPKEFVIPLNTSLSVGEKVNVTKLLDSPLDPWANYKLTINLDYGAKQQLPLNSQINYRNQTQLTRYLIIGGIFLVIFCLTSWYLFKKRYHQNHSTPKYKYIPKHILKTTNSAVISGSVTLSPEQMQELIKELKKEVKTVIESEINNPTVVQKVNPKKLAHHDLMDSFQRYLNS